MGAGHSGGLGPNGVIATPILSDPPLSGKGRSMSTAIAAVVEAIVSPKDAASEPLSRSASGRRDRGHAIATIARIVQKDGQWAVPSQSGKGSYRVVLEPPSPSVPMCTCKDFAERGEPCKHVFAVRAVIEEESNPGTLGVLPATATGRTAIARGTLPSRPTYRQDWPAYNAAQIHEKARFQVLLSELCQGVKDRPTSKKGGRPPISMADRLFSAAFKVYTTMSGRRASTDMRDAREKGHLTQSPHYSRVSRFLEDPKLTPILRNLIVESSRPLASVEVDFAGDSSGFTTCRFESWYDHKYGVIRRQHEWVKVHVMVGVKTNIVTAVEIKDKDAQDAPLLPPMLRTTAENFTMKEVSLDKVYASLNNYAEIDRAGAVPYIPFKSIHTGAGGGLWAKMFHYYNFNREEFLSHYHKRSNVESTFSMIKAKFGDSLRSKTDTAMANESLCKILCHNICCLIQSQYELGIEATFWGVTEEKQAEMAMEPMADGVEAWDWV